MLRKDFTLGMVLIVIGILFLLFNLGILTFNWLLLILSIGFLIVYSIKRQTGYLAAGLLLLAISIINIMDEHAFTTVNIKSFIFLWILGIISLVMYSRQGTRGYLILGSILPAIGTYNLVEELTVTNVYWTFFLFMAIAFYLIYRVGYSQFNIVWPKTLASILGILSLIFLLSSQKLLRFKFWKAVSFLWPILIIIIGIRIIYNIYQLRE